MFVAALYSQNKRDNLAAMGSRATTRRARQAAAKRPRVVAGYLRLTEDRDGVKIGYEVQRERIAAWAESQGYEVRWFKDEDLSAAKREVVRPEYEAMLARVQAGEFAGVVVWRLDRLVRLTREFERCFGIIDDAKAFVQDIEQGINSEQPIGMMFMRLLVMMAEMEIAAMRARARAHQQWKAERGQLSAGGFRPFGFVGVVRDEKTNHIVNPKEALIAHDPEEAELVREAAKSILSDGASYADVVERWANRKPPVRGTNGKPVNLDALYQILTRPRIAGLREYEIVDEETGEVTTDFAKAVWEPILDRATWEALRARRRLRGPINSKQTYLLNGGLVKCGKCRQPMVCGTRPAYKTGERVGMYRCNPTLSARETGSCGTLQIDSQFTDETTCALLFERLNASPELLDLINGEESEAASAERAAALEEIRVCNEALMDFGTRMALPDDHPMKLDEMESAGMRAGYRARKAEAERINNRLRQATGVPSPNDEQRADIPGWFYGLATGEKRSFLKAHLRDVFVGPRASGRNTFNPERIDPRFADAENADG